MKRTHYYATTLFMHGTGPLIKWGEGILYIEDLNPEVKTKWRMSRWEMFKLGLKCIGVACGL